MRGVLVAALSAAMMTATEETWFISIGVLVCAVIGTVIWCRIPLNSPWLRWHPRRRCYRGGFGSVPGHQRALLQLVLHQSARPFGFLPSVQRVVQHRRSGSSSTLVHASHLARPIEASCRSWLGGSRERLAAWRRDNAFAVFIGLWAVGIVAAYSLIGTRRPGSRSTSCRRWLCPPATWFPGSLASTSAPGDSCCRLCVGLSWW